MATHYVLIDFENVQPKNLEVLRLHPFKVLVFVGANQARLPFELAEAMQSLGSAGRYIKISGSGKNALDFHIAYYLGELIAADPKAEFHVISRDTGFDQLITHLNDRGYQVRRERDLAEIPVLRMSSHTPKEDKITAIVKNLQARAQSRPRKLSTLKNTIRSLFAEKLTDPELDEIVARLQDLKHLKIDKDDRVAYSLRKKGDGGNNS